LVLVFWIAMTASPALAQPDERLDASLAEQMPALLERYGVSGSVVAAIEDGDVTWARAYGWPMSPKTRRWGRRWSSTSDRAAR
jgi:hypothetical protein